MLAGVDLPGEEEALRAALEARGWAARGRRQRHVRGAARRHRERLGHRRHVRRRDQLRRPRAGRRVRPLSRARRHHRRLGRRLRPRPGGARRRGAQRDGRGPRTALERAVPAPFGSPTRSRGRDAPGAHLRAAAGRAGAGRRRGGGDDAVAAALLDRLADEILAFVRATLPQIDAGDAPVEVVLGGGLLQARTRASATPSATAWPRSIPPPPGRARPTRRSSAPPCWRWRRPAPTRAATAGLRESFAERRAPAAVARRESDGRAHAWPPVLRRGRLPACARAARTACPRLRRRHRKSIRYPHVPVLFRAGFSTLPCDARGGVTPPARTCRRSCRPCRCRCRSRRPACRGRASAACRRTAAR